MHNEPYTPEQRESFQWGATTLRIHFVWGGKEGGGPLAAL